MFRKSISGLAFVAVSVAVLSGVAATPAWAKSSSTTTTGIDVSYPQCGSSLPSGEAFAVVGVNGGLANDYNSCLGSEWGYALSSTGVTTTQAKAQTYLNTADPGNGVADWPSPSQLGAYESPTTPAGNCGYVGTATSGPGDNSPGCAYIYGYDMVAGIAYTGSTSGTIVGDLSTFFSATGRGLYAQPVWLDVETGNSWQGGTLGLQMNLADLQGMVAAITAAANVAGSTVSPIGVYSTSYQWGQIIGSPGSLGSLTGVPDWIPGAQRESGATSNCSLPSFTAGRVTVTQWSGHPYDGDYSCP